MLRVHHTRVVRMIMAKYSSVVDALNIPINVQT